MISIYGRSPVALPRKHNHFVPDGYIPPKNRQKIVSPPTRTKTILKSPGSSRNQTPNRRPNPNSRVSPHPRVSRENQNVRPQSSPPVPMLKSILKSSQNYNRGSTPSPRVKSTGTSPHCTPAWSQSSGCDAGGEDQYARRPPSRQMNAKVQESIGRGPYDGKPISVVDKYDERDNPIWWKGLCPLGRRGPPAKSSLRPHARRPNILFNRVVNSQGESSSSQSFREDDDDEEEDPKLCEPCCGPVDWDRDPMLRSITDRQAYRQCKLEDYLREVCTRCDPPERFANFLIRCYAYANEELNSHRSKHLLGYVDEHLSPLDVWVLRLHRGTVSRLLRFSD